MKQPLILGEFLRHDPVSFSMPPSASAKEKVSRRQHYRAETIHYEWHNGYPRTASDGRAQTPGGFRTSDAEELPRQPGTSFGGCDCLQRTALPRAPAHSRCHSTLTHYR